LKIYQSITSRGAGPARSRKDVQDLLQNNGDPDSQRGGEGQSGSRDYSELTEEKLHKPNTRGSMTII